ncbi:hypothetical protein F5876DRAFT_72662 [Lentinula aff. lateritia]|uniref:Uncharacterized protein n=1 Tax=Lentinula aff. lateritia TaxID=2804960 RepID=A0ACC1UDM3_9AGAR|nr:hypothetical protein F5876DRAFT_72662 [Lentinula aff. lateritia]
MNSQSQERRHADEDDSLGDTTDEEAPSEVAMKLEEEEGEKKALAILMKRENPELEVKKEALVLPIPASTVLSMLDGIKAYVLNPTQELHCEVDVSREFMSNVFGGNTQYTFPAIGKDKFREHGLKDFMYLSKSFNPVAPTIPGQSGLFFSHDNFWLPNINVTARELEDAEQPEWAKVSQRVLTRLKPNHWLYVGQYTVSFSRALTSSEWENLSEKVKGTWVKNIAERGWATIVRARLLLRDRLGRRPSVAEVNKKLKRAKKSATKLKGISEDRILKAFQTGEELLLMWTMECVDYDANLQLRLANESKLWSSSLQKSTKQDMKNGSRSRKKSKGATTKLTVTPNRKRKRSDDSDYEPTGR